MTERKDYDPPSSFPSSPPSLKYSQSKGDWRRLVPQDAEPPKVNLSWPTQSWRDPLQIENPKEYLKFVLQKEEEAEQRARWLHLKEWKTLTEGPISFLTHNRDQVEQLEQVSGRTTALVLAAMDRFRPKSASSSDYERAMSEATEWLLSDKADQMMNSEEFMKYIEAESQFDASTTSPGEPTREGPMLQDMKFFRGATEVTTQPAVHGANIPCTTACRILYCPAKLRGGTMLNYSDESLQLHGRERSCLESMIEFRTDVPSIIYIAIDHRMAESGQAPDWLSVFDYDLVQDDVLVSSDESNDPGYYVLYKSRPSLKSAQWTIGYPYTGLAQATQFMTYKPLVAIVVKLNETEIKSVGERGEVHHAV